MADSPTLYVRRFLDHGESNWTLGYEVASPAEIKAAARAHVDYIAALNVLIQKDMNRGRGLSTSDVRAAIDAALRETEAGRQ